MSDTVLQGDTYRFAPAHRRAQARGGNWRRRFKVLGDIVEYVSEVKAEMQRGREQHPVISAYRR